MLILLLWEIGDYDYASSRYSNVISSKGYVHHHFQDQTYNWNFFRCTFTMALSIASMALKVGNWWLKAKKTLTKIIQIEMIDFNRIGTTSQSEVSSS